MPDGEPGKEHWGNDENNRCGCCGCGHVRAFSRCTNSDPAYTAGLAQFSASIEDLARASSPAVVQIAVRGRAPLEEGGVQRTGFIADQRATGSGVIVDPDGYIVTNAHVVFDARHIDVSVIEPGQPGQPAKHKHFSATTVGLDRETDIAVLKIEARRALWLLEHG